MSRFKEKRRIDSAITHRNIEELECALSYCKMRLEHSTMKQHEKTWLQEIKKIETVISEEE